MRPLLGTFVEAGARGPAAAQAVEAAFRSIAEAHALWSFHSPDSDLSCLNRRPGERVHVGRMTLRLLRLAAGMMRRSDHAFDCSVGGTLVRQGRLPDHGGPEPLSHGSPDDIELGDSWARLRRPVRLTLDGIAKGYAVDLAAAAMRRHGADSGWINAGGDLRAFGDVDLPVQLRECDGTFTAVGRLRNAALASSRVEPPGKGSGDEAFAASIVGRPGFAPVAGLWTVLARCAWRADALTKVAANTPADRRADAVRQLGGCLVLPRVGAPS